MENPEDLAKKRVQARMGFVVHLAMYLVMNAGLVGIWQLSGRGYPWFVWPMLGWGIAILAHAITLAIGPDSTAERHAIDRELKRINEATH